MAAAGSAGANPGEFSSGPHLTLPATKEANLPAGCVASYGASDPHNRCFHQVTSLNSLSSPDINVSIVVPVSPTAERDLRIMKQAVNMWAGGLHYLSGQLGMDWLRRGVRFHVTTLLVDVDASGVPRDPITLRNPQIVVVATNPVGATGIGISPLTLLGDDPTVDEVSKTLDVIAGTVPCLQIPSPFDLGSWESLPGYDGHHGQQGGTYQASCGGVSTETCFAVNGAIDPLAGMVDTGVREFSPMTLFDLVAHEVGHCLTLGHVGDGADGPWGVVPTDDVMAYATDPPGKTKCVSSLDVESFAISMSRLLDVNGDGAVNRADHLAANNGELQTQNPADHVFASSTGDSFDCPQPDMGLVPGAEPRWIPTPKVTRKGALSMRASSTSKGLLVRGRASLSLINAPTAPQGALTDQTGDAPADVFDIRGVRAKVTGTTLEVSLQVAQLQTLTTGGAPTSYSIMVGHRGFDSFVPPDAVDSAVATYDSGKQALLPAGTSTWDMATSTVSFHIPRLYLLDQTIRAPYFIQAFAGAQVGPGDLIGRDQLPVYNAGLPTYTRVHDLDVTARLGVAGVPLSVPAVTLTPARDADRDTVVDTADRCPRVAGDALTGCPTARTARVRVYVDGVLRGVQTIAPVRGSYDYRLSVPMRSGRHVVKVVWYASGEPGARVVAQASRVVGG